MDNEIPAQLISKTEAYVKEWMSHYDSSHDYTHIQRVVYLAEHIARTEPKKQQLPQSQSPRTPKYDPLVVKLAALLHDVGDHKYLPAGQDGDRMAYDFLVSISAPLDLAERVQEIANRVSYSKEIKDPSRVADALERHPELGPVQDADRLDALGAVGMARCFTYHGLKGGEEWGLDSAIAHFHDKLMKLEAMMKTETGRELARERTIRVKEYIGWWEDEVDHQRPEDTDI